MDTGVVVAVERDTRSTTGVVSWAWATADVVSWAWDTADVVDCVEVSDDI